MHRRGPIQLDGDGDCLTYAGRKQFTGSCGNANRGTYANVRSKLVKHERRHDLT